MILMGSLEILYRECFSCVFMELCYLFVIIVMGNLLVNVKLLCVLIIFFILCCIRESVEIGCFDKSLLFL